MVPALDNAGKTATLGHARNVDHIAVGEHLAVDNAADRIVRGILVTELAQETRGLSLDFFIKTGFGLVELALFDLLVCANDRAVTVVLDGARVDYGHGTALHDGNGNGYVVLVEYTRHA